MKIKKRQQVEISSALQSYLAGSDKAWREDFESYFFTPENEIKQAWESQADQMTRQYSEIR